MSIWWDTQGKVVPPLVGSVFYPVEMDIDGGYLEIFSRGENIEPERLEAKFNRLVIFDAGAHHHRVTQVNRGTRSALAINLWAEPPSGLAHGAIVPE